MSMLESKRLTLSMIDRSPEIQSWLTQFGQDRMTAISMLMGLEFVSIDMYSTWFNEVMRDLPPQNTYALFSVRKLSKDENHLWDNNGKVIKRPGAVQGSEDLVHALIRNTLRLHKSKFVEHPSLDQLRRERIHDIVLVDDSIGSGQRVIKYLRAMLSHATFLSWWSFGWLRLHIISYTRIREAEANILAALPGSNHHLRKYPKTSKIRFISEKVYSLSHPVVHWGTNHGEIIRVVDQITTVPMKYRRGWGRVMAKTVFFHSVPNNVPGVIWHQNDRWQALCPDRAIPNWLVQLLEETQAHRETDLQTVSEDTLNLLSLLKRGVRSREGLALRLNGDTETVSRLLESAIAAGLVNTSFRLTRTGYDLLIAAPPPSRPVVHRSIYVPTSWCAD